MTSIWKLDIPRDVQIAKWGLGLLVLAFGSAFLYFVSEFKEVRRDLAGIQASQSAQNATASAMQASLSRIESRLGQVNGNAQGGPRDGQTR